MTDKEAVLAANTAFYQAFSTGDYKTMKTLWSVETEITVIHPGWPSLHGHKSVMRSWQRIIQAQGQTNIHCVDERIYLFDTIAYVICMEVFDEADLIATNIFIKEEAGWKLTHHQAAPMSSMSEAQTNVTMH